jgi:Holliday junction resolvase RusA-like endonuclease
MDVRTTVAGPATKRDRGRPPFRSALLTLPLPPSTNALFLNVPGRGRVRTPQYREWSETAGWQIRTQLGSKKLPIPAPVAIEIRTGLPKRPRDLGNLEKALTDCLVDYGVIGGDDNKHVTGLDLAWSAEIEPGMVQITVRQTMTPQTCYRISLAKRGPRSISTAAEPDVA